MSKIIHAIAMVAMTGLLIVGCQKTPDNKADSQAKVYDIAGKVVSVDEAKKSVKLDHEDIPGLMKAMTMNFSVDDPKLLEGLKPDDKVSGQITTGGSRTGYTITRLEKR